MELKAGLLVTGDASGGVKAIRLTEEQLGKLNAKSKRTQKVLKEQSTAVADARKKMSLYAGVLSGAVTAGLGAMIKSQLGVIDNLAKTSDRLGISTEALTAFRHAAELNGFAADSMDAALRRMVKRLGLAEQGGGAAAKAIEQFGLSNQEFFSKRPEEQYQILADKIAGLETQNLQVAAASQVFGDEGIKIVNLLNQGSAAFDDARRETELFGTALTRVEAGQIEKANDAILRAQSFFDGFAKQITVQFAPLLEAIADQFFNVAAEAGGMGNIASRVFKSVTKAAGIFADGVHAIVLAFKAVRQVVAEVINFVIQRWNDAVGFLLEGLSLLPGPIGEFAADAKSTLQDLADGAQEITDDLYQGFQDTLGQQIPSESIEEWTETVERQVKDAEAAYTASIDNMEQATAPFNEALTKSQEANEKIIEGLEKRLALVGLEGEALQVATALQQLSIDATEDQIAQVEKLTREIYQQEEAARKLKDEEEKAAQQRKEQTEQQLKLEKELADQRKKDLEAFRSSLADIAGLSSTQADAVGDAFKDFSTLLKDSDLFGDLASELETTFAGVAESFESTFAGLDLGGALGGLAGGVSGALEGDFASLGSSLGTLAGTAFLGPIGGAIGGLIGGLAGDLIGPKPSDKTQLARIDTDTFSVEGDGFGGKKFSQENRDAAVAAGNVVSQFAQFLEAETERQISFDNLEFVVGNRDGIRLAIDGQEVIDTSSIEQTLDETFKLLAADVGLEVQAFEDLAVAGETLFDTMVRLGEEVANVSGVSNLLGLNFDDIATRITNIDNPVERSADAIIQMSGGLDSFQAKAAFFVDNIADQSAIAARAADEYRDSLSAFNAQFDAAVSTESDLRDFVDALDLTTEAGQEAFVAALELAPALSALEDHLADLQAPIDALNQSAADFINDINAQVADIGLTDQEIAVRDNEQERQAAIDELNRLRDEGADIIGGYDTVLSNINTLYDTRLQELTAVEVPDIATNLIDQINAEFAQITEGSTVEGALNLNLTALESERQAAIDALNELVEAGAEVAGTYDEQLGKINTVFDTRAQDLRDAAENARLSELGVDTDFNADGVIDELDKLFVGISAFASDLSGEAFDNTLSDSDREILFLEEWRDNALAQLKTMQDEAGDAFGDLFDFAAINEDIELVYAQRLEDIGNRYEDVVTASEAAAKAQEDLEKALASVDKQFDSSINSIQAAINKLSPDQADTVDPVQAIEDRYATELQLIDEQKQAAIDAYNEQLKAVNEFNEAAAALEDTANSLLFGDLSTLTSREQLAASEAQFADAANRARNGDAGAVEELQGLSQQTLQLGRDVFASSPEFTRLFEDVQATLREVGATRLEAPDAVDVSEFDRAQESLRVQTLETLQELLAETQRQRQEARNNVNQTFSSATI